MNCYLICILLEMLLTSSALTGEAAEWGPTVDGLRMSAAIVKNAVGYYELEWTIENTSLVDEKLLVLGKMGYRNAELITVIVTEPDGSRHAASNFGPRSGTAPSRELPMIVPLLPKSSYSIRTLLGGWAYYAPSLRRVESLLSQPATLQLQLQVGMDSKPSVKTDCSLDCFGLQIFWRGKLVSNLLRFPVVKTPERGPSL